jgi:hypothetical protein
MLNRLQGVFASLERNDVKYLVIGGIAAVLYGVPRATFDLVILIEPTPENARRMLRALEEAGLGTAALTTPEEVLENEITIFDDWVRIDAQSRTPDIEFGVAWPNRVEMEYQGQKFQVVSRQDLIASKRAAEREVDLRDVHLLELPEDE